MNLPSRFPTEIATRIAFLDELRFVELRVHSDWLLRLAQRQTRRDGERKDEDGQKLGLKKHICWLVEGRGSCVPREPPACSCLSLNSARWLSWNTVTTGALPKLSGPQKIDKNKILVLSIFQKLID